MKFIVDSLSQKQKNGYSVCGDYCLCRRTEAGTMFVLCDGIGSGLYANIAAISCAERLMELTHVGFSLRTAAETVAASMHRARKENIPFSAFSAVYILPDGHFTVYAYESPEPILLRRGTASVLSTRFYTAGFEVIGESLGYLHRGDSLLLASDGMTQAGLGHGYGLGIGSKGITDYINKQGFTEESIGMLGEKIIDYCKKLSGNRYEDDTTIALLNCREANELILLTGPPSKPAMDNAYARLIHGFCGKKVVCGSTTLDIISRELNLSIETLNLRVNSGGPPEYFVDGIDIATEGAITLNQVLNIIEEPIDRLSGNGVVKRLCKMLLEADVLHFHIGNAVNEAHDEMFFMQVGIQIRKNIIETLIKKLRKMGKVVSERYY